MSEKDKQPANQRVDRRLFVCATAAAGIAAALPDDASAQSPRDVVTTIGPNPNRSRTDGQNLPPPVFNTANAADVATTERAFAALSRGDASVVLNALDPSVRWRAVGVREFGEGVTFDSRGANLYLNRMARSIGTGRRRLEIRSVTPSGDSVVVVSAWVQDLTAQNCINHITFANGRVISVTEAAR